MTTLDPARTPALDPRDPPPVGMRLLLTLVAGRSIFRIVLFGANLALLAAWTRADFDKYAAASAGLAWMVALAQAGPEKAALKLIPRTRHIRDALVAGLVWGIRLVPALAGVAAAVALAVDRHGTATLYLVMAAESAAVGCNVAAVGVLRALGRTGYDPRNFAVLSTGWIVITAAALAVGMDPVAYVALQFLLTVGVTELTLFRVGAPIRNLTGRPRVLRILAGTVALMGVQDVVACVAVSWVFFVLPLTGHADQSGELYVAVAGWAIVLAFFTYLLRVFQPRVSLRLAGGGAQDGRKWGRVLGWWALGINGAWLASMALTIRAPGLASPPAGRPTVATLVALLASHTPVMLLTGLGLYLLENSDGGSLRHAARAGAANLAVVAVVAVAVVPHYGAVGAVWAFAAGEMAPAAMLIRRAAPGRPAIRLGRADPGGLSPVSA
jgi:hypothetical protein